MKKIIFIVFLMVTALAGFVGYWSGANQAAQSKATPSTHVELKLSKEVVAAIDSKIDPLQSLLKSPAIIEGLKKSNDQNKNLTQALINQQDNKWQDTKGIDDSIRPYLANPAAKELLTFQGNNPQFPEIFVTDSRGLIVGLTNKTSDFYQADEDWWVKAYDNGKGQTYHGEIEFDESAQTEAIAIYVPVMDPASGKAIGVLKALLDINSIKAEL